MRMHIIFWNVNFLFEKYCKWKEKKKLWNLHLQFVSCFNYTALTISLNATTESVLLFAKQQRKAFFLFFFKFKIIFFFFKITQWLFVFLLRVIEERRQNKNVLTAYEKFVFWNKKKPLPRESKKIKNGIRNEWKIATSRSSTKYVTIQWDQNIKIQYNRKNQYHWIVNNKKKPK